MDQRTDRPMDRPTDRPTDGQTLLQRCVDASKNPLLLSFLEAIAGPSNLCWPELLGSVLNHYEVTLRTKWTPWPCDYPKPCNFASFLALF